MIKEKAPVKHILKDSSKHTSQSQSVTPSIGRLHIWTVL